MAREAGLAGPIRRAAQSTQCHDGRANRRWQLQPEAARESLDSRRFVQVARLESDLADEIPKIRLRLQHQEVEYRPVPLPDSKAQIWLPSSTEMYMDFIGRRFYRRHSFTNLKFFSVKVEQMFGDPKE